MTTRWASGLLWANLLGNHESDGPGNAARFANVSDSGGECGSPTQRLLPLPAPATAAAPWYSLDVGLVHLIGLSTEHDFGEGSPQLAWLAADLAAVNRSRTPWLIAGLHRPM